MFYGIQELTRIIDCCGGMRKFLTNQQQQKRLYCIFVYCVMKGSGYEKLRCGMLFESPIMD